MNRRQLLKGAGAAALCGSAFADVNPVCITLCHGLTCGALGMAGTYPNCYYPQYLNYNAGIGNTARYWGGQVVNLLRTRTLDAATMNNAKYWYGMLAQHLSIGTTQIAESARKQWIGAELPPKTSLTQAEMNNITTLALNAGYPNQPANWIATANSTLPASKTADPTFEQLVANLPNQTALDNLNTYTMEYVNSIDVGTGICELTAAQVKRAATVGQQLDRLGRHSLGCQRSHWSGCA